MKKNIFAFATLFLILFFFIWLFSFTRNQMQPSLSLRTSFLVPSSTFSPSPSSENTTSIASASPKTRESVRVVRVIDGDTVEVEGDRKVRYIGVDTPELTDKRKLVNCFAQKAKEKNRELVEGQLVTLEKDVSETDRYGRVLRYVYRENLFINEFLLQEGYAYASSFPPDISYQVRFKALEKEAREHKRGLWGSECSSSV